MFFKEVIALKVSIIDFNSYVERIKVLAQGKTSSYICVANAHMTIEAHSDSSFAEVVNNANLVSPDGLPLTWALRLIHGIKQERVAGMDLLPDLLSIAESNKWGVYFYGGSEELGQKSREYVKKHYPKLANAHFESPPFRELTEQEELECIERINASGANLVFVVLGCPKQEKWMARMKGKINSVMIGVGGALPVLVGVQKRAPKWMQKAGLEWFYRLKQEPRRLFKRYLVTNSIFLILLMRDILLIRILKLKRKSFIDCR
jgi:N-acetylglucosaminyldiphosphoundecaprenol N-acetyl-beta-D-mannosaminyltransferase